MKDLIQIELKEGIQVIDSRIIAKGININHKSLMETIRKYQQDLEDLGTLPFETEVWKHKTGATTQVFCYLNELQCHFLITLSRNTKEVVSFKKGLVIAFHEAKQQLANQNYVSFEFLESRLKKYSIEQREISLAYADAVYTMLNERLQKLEAKFTLPSLDTRVAYVYLMRIIGTKECKIGKSIKPLDRLVNFEQAGVNLELLSTIEFPSEKLALSAEKFLHLVFKDKHLKGEWFLLEESDIALFLHLSETFANWR